MLKLSVLLCLVAVNINLNGSESYLSHIWEFTPLRRHGDYVSREKVAAVLRDPQVLKLFKAADRLLTVVPGKKDEGVCMCYTKGEDDTVELFHAADGNYMFYTPWAHYLIKTRSNLREDCEIVRSNGLEFREKSFMGSLIKIKITALDGETLPKKSLSSSERCAMFAAWQLYQLPEERAARARWSSARRAWVGSVVRSGNARKPVVVVAAESKE